MAVLDGVSAPGYRERDAGIVQSGIIALMATKTLTALR
jgi:hypothetical protein